MANPIAAALALSCCAGLGFMAAVALADPPEYIGRAGSASRVHAGTEVPPRISIIDGDSLRINGAPVRLAFIDAPELRQRCLDAQRRSYACGEASANALRAMIERDPGVTCEARGRDRYGRVLAVCSNGSGDLGMRLVMQGWATAYRKYSPAYVDHEAAARAEQLGMWSGEFQMPEQYRRDKR